MTLAPREIELKLEVAPTAVSGIKRQLSQVCANKPSARTLVSVYFDTPRWTLRKHGMSLRVRRVGRQYVQTLKCAAAPTAGFYDRAEWEHATTGPKPELSWMAKPALGALSHEGLAKSLRPVFQTRVRRTEYRLARSGAVISAALDHGTVRAGSRHCVLCELELELSSGSPGALFSVANALGRNAGTRLCIKTKADRGYELLRKMASTAPAPRSLEASPTSTAGEAFQTIARGCLRQLIANQDAVLASDGEALHRMRIALRRLRTAIRVFSAVVVDSEWSRVKSELRWLAGQLGPARDLDVFIADVVGPLREHHAHDREVTRICRAFGLRRARVYRVLGASIRSQRYRHLELELARWIEVGPWVTCRSGSAPRCRDRPVTLLAAKALTRWRKNIKKAGRRLSRLSHRQRHRLRIRGKRLRYAVEFFSGLFPGRKRAKRYGEILSALTDLQDSLGALNDLARRGALSSHHAPVTGSKGGPLTEIAPISKAIAMRASLATQGPRVGQLLNTAKRAYKRFRDVKPFWE